VVEQLDVGQVALLVQNQFLRALRLLEVLLLKDLLLYRLQGAQPSQHLLLVLVQEFLQQLGRLLYFQFVRQSRGGDDCLQ